LWIGDAQNAQAHTEAKVLRIAKSRLDIPLTGSGDRLHLGMVADIKSESPAGLRRNSQ
jgi:hypothetical protein